jgi:phosphinothricin acetyltransferase
MSACSIRVATRDDAGIINDIQNYYVLSSTATFHTESQTLDERLAWLDGRSRAHPVTVAEADGAVVGWGALEIFRSRPAYRHTAELSVYVHHERHRLGIGRAIVADLIQRARTLGHHTLVGGCCSETTSAIALLEASGFTRVARFREVGHKFDRWLDVVFLQRLL